MNLGAYHCLYAPHGISVNLADLLTALICWVQHGIAPGTIEADTWSRTPDKITLYQEVRPYNALAPVTPRPGLPERSLSLPRHLPLTTGRADLAEPWLAAPGFHRSHQNTT